MSKPFRWITIFIFVLLAFGFSSSSIAQVSISPTALFFTSQKRFSSLTISNGSEQAQEISISTEFGFPTTRNGNLIISKDSSLAVKKSMAGWIKAFPRNFTLQPNKRQLVRFLVRPSGNIKAGGYWSRVKISSNAVSPPIDSTNNGVGARINLVVNQIIGAHYRTGKAQTGVKVSAVSFTQNDSTNSGQLAISMKRTGNAPFVGSLEFSIKGKNSEEIYHTRTTNSIYTTITRKFNINLDDASPGTYTVDGNVTSNRSDISEDKLLQIKPVSFSRQITIK